MTIEERARECAEKIDHAQMDGRLNEDYLAEFVLTALREQIEECAQIAVAPITFLMQIPCPVGYPGCLVFHSVEAPRVKTSYEIAKELRALADNPPALPLP